MKKKKKVGINPSLDQVLEVYKKRRLRAFHYGDLKGERKSFGLTREEFNNSNNSTKSTQNFNWVNWV